MSRHSTSRKTAWAFLHRLPPTYPTYRFVWPTVQSAGEYARQPGSDWVKHSHNVPTPSRKSSVSRIMPKQLDRLIAASSASSCSPVPARMSKLSGTVRFLDRSGEFPVGIRREMYPWKYRGRFSALRKFVVLPDMPRRSPMYG